ncbi:MAG: hypothetical protein ACYCO3_08450 [Mycobacteriales bacterium]
MSGSRVDRHLAQADANPGTEWADSKPGTAEELVEVRLLGLPVRLHRQAQEHADELIREFTLIAEQLSDEPAAETHSVPPRLVELVAQLTHRYAAFTDETEQRLARAERTGEGAIDLVLRLPPSAAAAARTLDGLLDEADAYCRQGQHLLTLAPAPESLRYRRWYLGQVAAQIDGARPTPWPQAAR